jgi:hypothetical protein
MAPQIYNRNKKNSISSLMKYEDIVEIAEVISNNKTINRDSLILEYKLSSSHHKKMNEELFFVSGLHLSDEELIYHDVIELTVLDVNFRFLKEE